MQWVKWDLGGNGWMEVGQGNASSSLLIQRALNEQRVDPLGTEMLRSIFLFDESVARFRIGARNWSQEISKRLGIKSRVGGAAPPESGTGESSTAMPNEYIPDLVPISIVLQTEKRVIMIQYDEISMIRFRLREVKYSDFAGPKSSITCMEFLSSYPLIALGCADGAIRFWNYSTAKVEEGMTLRGVHQKAIVKIAVVHQNREHAPHDDTMHDGGAGENAHHETIQFNSYPTMVSLSAEGTLVSWNLDKKRPEYTKTKSQDGVAVYDMHVDPELGTIAVLGYDKSIIVRSLSTADELRRIKLDMTKANLNNIFSTHSVGGGSSSPAWYLLTAAGSSKIFQISSTLNADTWIGVPDIRDLGDLTLPKKAKIYNVAVHPIHSDTFFCGTNFGLFIFQLGDRTHATPTVTRSLSLVSRRQHTGSPSSPNSSGNATSQFSLERCMYFVRERAVWKRTASARASSSVPQQLDYDKGTKMFDLGSDAPVRIHASHSGKFLSVFWYLTNHLCVYNIDHHTNEYSTVIYERNDVREMCWCNFMDRFALIKTGTPFKELEIHHIDHGSGSESSTSTAIVPIISNQFTATCGKIRQIFGGRLLGVSYEDRSDFHFIQWNGRKSLGEFLPQPIDVKWCELTQHVVLTYEESYAIFSFKSSFQMQNYVNEKVRDAMWWNGSLFILTTSDVRCVFVGNGQKNISETIIASFDIGDIGIKSSANAEEEALDPVPQTRPSGTLALVDVLSDRLYAIDAFGRLHSLNLDHPALKFRMLVCAHHVEQALGWIPYIPVDLHNFLAIFLSERGYSKTAVSELHQLKPSTKFKLCIQYGHHNEAYQTLVDEIDVDNPSSILLSDEALGKLYMRLAHLAEQKNDTNMASDCLERACELQYIEAFRSMCVHCARHGKMERLQQLQKQLEELQREDPLRKEYTDILSMVRLFLGGVP